MNSTQMNDSGSRRTFATGAQRDRGAGKPRPDLVSPFWEERLAIWLALGAEKYAARNWERGMPVSECWASLRRHVVAFAQGKDDEDHLAAIGFNAMAIAHYQEMIRRGLLTAELDDMPRYTKPEVPASGNLPLDGPSQQEKTPGRVRIQLIPEGNVRASDMTRLRDWLRRILDRFRPLETPEEFLEREIISRLEKGPKEGVPG